MLEKMMSVLASFNSLGSGWTLEKVLKVDVKFARFRPIHSSSYIALPSKNSNCRRLLNVRNHEDRDCFRYCFVEAHHKYHQISLYKIDRNKPTKHHQLHTINQDLINLWAISLYLWAWQTFLNLKHSTTFR